MSDSVIDQDMLRQGCALTRHSITASILLVFVVWVAYPICQAIFLFGGDLRIPYLVGKPRHQVEATLGEPYRSYRTAQGWECLHHLAHVSLRVSYDGTNTVERVENPDLIE